MWISGGKDHKKNLRAQNFLFDLSSYSVIAYVATLIHIFMTFSIRSLNI